MKKLRRLLPMTAIALCSVAAEPASADDSEMEALYSRYHKSIEAAKLCRKLSFDQAAHDRMAEVIHRHIEHQIGAKRLSLMTAAQRGARALIEREGCDGDGAQELLALFDADLAPVLQ